jgi:hypothetical protein
MSDESETSIDPVDPMIAQIGVEWLNQYARFLRRTPELVTRLAADSADFELVPVPKKLLDRLAVPGIVGSGSLGGRIDPEIEELLRIGVVDEPAVVSGPKPASTGDGPVAVIEALGVAIENGRLEDAMELLSPHFLDEDGRNPQDIRTAVARLIGETAHRRFRIAKASETRRSPRDTTISVIVAWDAAPVSNMPAPAISEEVTFEVILEEDEDNRWKIVSLKSG